MKEKKQSDEESALSIVFSNTKRQKRATDLVTVARAFQYLSQLYGSQKEVSKKVGLSPEMVREFLSILRLPKEVQDLIQKRKIDSIDIAKQLSSIRDPDSQIALAQQISMLSTDDVRDVRRMVTGKNMSVDDAIKCVISAKPVNVNLFVLDLEAEDYQILISKATEKKITPADLAKEVLAEWLHGDGK